MKKLLLTAAASVAMVGAFAAPASATSLTDWTLYKVKRTHIEDHTYVHKDVIINVEDNIPLDSAAKSIAVVNSDIVYNNVGAPVPGLLQFTADLTDYNIWKKAVITGSISDDTGIGQVNQDAGNNSNQGNVVSAALVFGGDALVSAEAYEQDINVFNTVEHRERFDAGVNPLNPAIPLPANLSAVLNDSLNDNTGVFMANQNVGNMNSQHNVLSAAVGENAFTALADAGLDQINGANTVIEVNTVKSDEITNSIIGNVGIVMFNQSVGNMNNQSTIVNAAVLASSVGL